MNLLLKGLSKINEEVTLIPTNSQKFLCMKFKNILLLDSCAHLPASLDSLVETIKCDDENFKLLNSVFGKNAKYLKRKGVFCYDYMDSFKRFNETCLPSKEEFFNRLTDESISDNDYIYAQKLFRKFKMKTLWDYTKLYLRTDTLLLACVFENYRSMSLNNFG